MDSLWGMMDRFIGLWNSWEVEGDQVVFGPYTYPTSLGKEEIGKRLMFEADPGLKCVFDPGIAMALAGEADPDLVAVTKTDDSFNPVEVVRALADAGLLVHQDGKLVMHQDESKLDEFYKSLYNRIFPEELAPFAKTCSPYQMKEAYRFLRNDGYLFCQYSFEDVRQKIEEAGGDAVELVLQDTSLKRYVQYGAFGLDWQDSVKQPQTGAAGSEALAKSVCVELVAHNFWDPEREQSFLSDNPAVNPSVFWDRSHNQATYGFMQLLTYFGITMYRERGRPHLTSVGLVFQTDSVRLVPEASQAELWKNAYDSGAIDRYVDMNAPEALFPGPNAVFKGFFSDLRKMIDTY